MISSMFAYVILLIRDLSLSYNPIIAVSASQMKPNIATSVPCQSNMSIGFSQVKMLAQISSFSHNNLGSLKPFILQ